MKHMNTTHGGEKADPVECPWCGGMFSKIWRHIANMHPAEISQYVNVCRICRQEIPPTTYMINGYGNSARNQEEKKEPVSSSRKKKEVIKNIGTRKKAGSSLERHFDEEHKDGKCRFCKMMMKFEMSKKHICL